MTTDFTSSLYLGLHHPSHTLGPWSSLTTGGPAALGVPRPGRRVAAEVARLHGTGRALLAPSTLHALSDCVDVLGGAGTAVVVDRFLYQVGAAAADRSGVTRTVAGHLDAEAAARAAARCRRRGLAPLLLADGLCAGCGGVLPVRDYVSIAESYGGHVVVDDTQAFGVVGPGGGGTAARARVTSPRLVVVASMAKAYGAPLAVVSGARPVVERLASDGPSRSHSSPPSLADIRAAERALALNASAGDRVRRRLARLVARLRSRLRAAGIEPAGGLFPVQSLPPLPRAVAARIYRRLLDAGVRTVVQKARCVPGATVTLIVNATHTTADVDSAADAVARAWHAEVRRAA